VTIAVFGLRAGERRGYGETVVTPIGHQEVAAVVALAAMPCGAWCTPGAAACQGDAVVRCEQRDADVSLEWSVPDPCPAAAPYCSHGQCAATCIDECVSGEQRCDGPAAFRLCATPSADHCAVWQVPVACPGGELCSNGVCGATCQDECTLDAARCAGAGVETCGDLSHDGCTEWGPVVVCATGTWCSNGVGAATCQDECTASVCDGLTFRECGQFDLDPCLDLSPGLSCAPSDPCREGACTAAGCTSAPKVCDQPPASTCVDASTLRTYDASGRCEAGGCVYHPHDVACPSCPSCDACAGVTCTAAPSVCFAAPGTCTAGSCHYDYADGTSCDDGDACTEGDGCAQGVCAGTAKQCLTPPAAACISPTVVRIYGGPGACLGGSCQYPYGDETCPGGCTNGACGGNPCGAGWCSLPVTDAPTARYDHGAVWTGSEMIVWGGNVGCSSCTVASGGRYNPTTNTWSPLDGTGAPSARYYHSAVWTGTEMIIWGGNTGCSGCEVAGGGRWMP
jgi:hypothetical protein